MDQNQPIEINKSPNSFQARELENIFKNFGSSIFYDLHSISFSSLVQTLQSRDIKG